MSSVPLHLQQRLAEKQQELEQLRILNQFAGHLMSHFDELSEKFDALAQGNLGTIPSHQMQKTKENAIKESRMC